MIWCVRYLSDIQTRICQQRKVQVTESVCFLASYRKEVYILLTVTYFPLSGRWQYQNQTVRKNKLQYTIQVHMGSISKNMPMMYSILNATLCKWISSWINVHLLVAVVGIHLQIGNRNPKVSINSLWLVSRPFNMQQTKPFFSGIYVVSKLLSLAY